jgi:hypothetical protein
MRQIDWTKWAAIAEILSAIAIVATLLYLAIQTELLAVQTERNNEIATASAEAEIRAILSSINEAALVNVEVAELLAKATDAAADFTTVEQIRLRAFLLRLMNGWAAIEAAENGRVLTETTASIIEDDVRSFVTRYPASAPIFRQIRATYSGQDSSELARAVDAVLDESD